METRVKPGVMFGHLFVLRFLGRRNDKHYWLCRCECGNTIQVSGSNLVTRPNIACGCERRKRWSRMGKAKIIHGESTHGKESKEFLAYNSMHGRCRTAKGYVDRGIFVCVRWSGRNGFLNFLKDVGRCPQGHSLDRIDNDGNYEPSNCRWADAKLQRANQRKRARLDQFSTSALESEIQRRK